MPTDDIDQSKEQEAPGAAPGPAANSPCGCGGASLQPADLSAPQPRVRRRSLLIGTAVAGALGFAARFLPPLGALRAQTQAGELYAGFLLLPEGAPPVPMSANPPPAGTAPLIMEQLPGGPQPTAVLKQFSAAQDLAKAVSFPIYTLQQAPAGTRPGSAWLESVASGPIFSASVSFQSYDAQHGIWLDNVSVAAFPNSPSPYPFRLSSGQPIGNKLVAPQPLKAPPPPAPPPAPPGSPASGVPQPVYTVAAPEKVSYLPSPGILWPTGLGYLFLWIRNGVLYRLQVENSPTAQQAQSIASSLAVASA